MHSLQRDWDHHYFKHLARLQEISRRSSATPPPFRLRASNKQYLQNNEIIKNNMMLMNKLSAIMSAKRQGSLAPKPVVSRTSYQHSFRGLEIKRENERLFRLLNEKAGQRSAERQTIYQARDGEQRKSRLSSRAGSPRGQVGRQLHRVKLGDGEEGGGGQEQEGCRGIKGYYYQL